MDIERIWQTLIAVVLAVSGGFARLLSLKGKAKLKWGRIASELFISGFAGLMVLMLARASGLSGDLIGVIAGISGWIGPRMLDLVAKVASKSVGVDFESKKDE